MIAYAPLNRRGRGTAEMSHVSQHFLAVGRPCVTDRISLSPPSVLCFLSRKLVRLEATEQGYILSSILINIASRSRKNEDHGFLRMKK